MTWVWHVRVVSNMPYRGEVGVAEHSADFGCHHRIAKDLPESLVCHLATACGDHGGCRQNARSSGLKLQGNGPRMPHLVSGIVAQRCSILLRGLGRVG